MRLLEAIRSLLPPDETGIIYECRACGTTMDADPDRCPECGSSGIAEYRL